MIKTILIIVLLFTLTYCSFAQYSERYFILNEDVSINFNNEETTLHTGEIFQISDKDTNLEDGVTFTFFNETYEIKEKYKIFELSDAKRQIFNLVNIMKYELFGRLQIDSTTFYMIDFSNIESLDTTSLVYLYFGKTFEKFEFVSHQLKPKEELDNDIRIYIPEMPTIFLKDLFENCDTYNFNHYDKIENGDNIFYKSDFADCYKFEGGKNNRIITIDCENLENNSKLDYKIVIKILLIVILTIISAFAIYKIYLKLKENKIAKQRFEEIKSYDPEITINELREMSDEKYNNLLKLKKKEYEAHNLKEQKSKQIFEEIKPFYPEVKIEELKKISDEEYNNLLKLRKKEYEALKLKEQNSKQRFEEIKPFYPEVKIEELKKMSDEEYNNLLKSKQKEESERLKEIERKKEKERTNQHIREREAQLKPYFENIEGFDLSEMTETEFTKLLAEKKKLYEEKTIKNLEVKSIKTKLIRNIDEFISLNNKIETDKYLKLCSDYYSELLKINFLKDFIKFDESKQSELETNSKIQNYINEINNIKQILNG